MLPSLVVGFSCIETSSICRLVDEHSVFCVLAAELFTVVNRLFVFEHIAGINETFDAKCNPTDDCIPLGYTTSVTNYPLLAWS